MADNTANRRHGNHRIFWLAVVGIILTVVAIEISSVMQESVTCDEGPHIAAGYSYWTTGDFALDVETPPLSKLVATTPLLFLRPNPLPASGDWRPFLYTNKWTPDTLLLATRATTVLLSSLLSVSLAWWVRQNFGTLAGIAAVVLLAFEPSVIAHSRYVNSDIPVTLLIWLSCISWYSYLDKPGSWALARTAIITGLAFATKFNAFALYLIFLATWFLYPIRPLGKTGKRRAAQTSLVLAGLPLVIILATYGFQTLFPVNHGPLKDVPVPGYYFFQGVLKFLRHQQSGHQIYLMGSISSRGSWKYFPTALLVKSCLGWLILLAGASFAVIRRQNRDHTPSKERRLIIALVVPVVVYSGFAIASPIDIGIRHLLPIYPFICAFIAAVLFAHQTSSWKVTALGMVLFAFVVESVTAYPHYLSFFNAALGADNGHKVLLDSNLDWGQDVKRLTSWVKQHDPQPLCVSVFATDPRDLGVNYEPLRSVRTAADLSTLNCVVAISAEHLYGDENSTFSALSMLNPSDRVGASIYIYDLRRH